MLGGSDCPVLLQSPPVVTAVLDSPQVDDTDSTTGGYLFDLQLANPIPSVQTPLITHALTQVKLSYTLIHMYV